MTEGQKFDRAVAALGARLRATLASPGAEERAVVEFEATLDALIKRRLEAAEAEHRLRMVVMEAELGITPGSLIAEAERRRSGDAERRARMLRMEDRMRRKRPPRNRPRRSLDLGGVPVEPNRPNNLTGGAAAALEFGEEG